jgi:NAD(P)-dependent dehydrogenase (short-subunit alcohol dehydrogenase family)
VICIDIQSPDHETTSKLVNESGGAAFYYQCDITSRDQVERTIESIEKDVGDITMLYHCCSLPSPRSVVNNPPSVKRTIDVSVTSYFYVSVFSYVYVIIRWTFIGFIVLLLISNFKLVFRYECVARHSSSCVIDNVSNYQKSSSLIDRK